MSSIVLRSLYTGMSTDRTSESRSIGVRPRMRGVDPGVARCSQRPSVGRFDSSRGHLTTGSYTRAVLMLPA